MPAKSKHQKIQELVSAEFLRLTQYDRFYFHMHRERGRLVSNPDAAAFNQSIRRSRQLVFDLAAELGLNSPTAIQVVSAKISGIANCGELVQMMMLKLLQNKVYDFRQHAVKNTDADHTFLEIIIQGKCYIIDPFFLLFIPEEDYLKNKDVLSYFRFSKRPSSINEIFHIMPVVRFSPENATPTEQKRTEIAICVLLSEAKKRDLSKQLFDFPHGTQTPQHVSATSKVIGVIPGVTVQTFKERPKTLLLDSDAPVRHVTFFKAADPKSFKKMAAVFEDEIGHSIDKKEQIIMVPEEFSRC